MMQYTLFLFLSYVTISFAQQDTVIYDSQTGNYVIQYLRENELGERDSLITLIFEPSTKINPHVHASIEFDKDSSFFIYKYRIANGSESRQNLIKFLVEYEGEVEVVDKSTQKWRSGKHSGGGHYGYLKHQIWYGNQGLEPTWLKDGFILASAGLPTIVSAYFQGKAPIVGFPYEPPMKIDKRVARLENFPTNYVLRKTVGPLVPPSPFVAIAFLDTLISYKHQAAAWGWLKDREDKKDEDDEDKDDTIVKKLDKRLEKVRKVLMKKDSVKARNELQKFVKKVEKLYKESQKHDKEKDEEEDVVLTSEAYALLKFNAEYLIDRLPKKKEKDDDD